MPIFDDSRRRVPPQWVENCVASAIFIAQGTSVTFGHRPRPAIMRIMISRLMCVMFMATLAVAQQQSAARSAGSEASIAEPALPVIDEQACPFEGCKFGKWKVSKDSTLNSSWQNDRRELAKLTPGQEVTAVTGVHITRSPDRILVKRDIPRLGLQAGDIVLRYMYVGEGFANIWAKGAWHKEEDCSFITEKNGDGCARDCAAIVTEEGVKEWWVKIKTPDGKLGWVLVSDNFQGMDALSE